MVKAKKCLREWLTRSCTGSESQSFCRPVDVRRLDGGGRLLCAVSDVLSAQATGVVVVLVVAALTVEGVAGRGGFCSDDAATPEASPAAAVLVLVVAEVVVLCNINHTSSLCSTVS